MLLHAYVVLPALCSFLSRFSCIAGILHDLAGCTDGCIIDMNACPLAMFCWHAHNAHVR